MNYRVCVYFPLILCKYSYAFSKATTLSCGGATCKGLELCTKIRGVGTYVRHGDSNNHGIAVLKNYSTLKTQQLKSYVGPRCNAKYRAIFFLSIKLPNFEIRVLF